MCFAARACSFATSNQAPAGSSPSRPPEPRRVWNAMTTPSWDDGIPIETRLARESRIEVRIRRLPSSGPALWIDGALKYFSSAISATAASSRHHAPASPPVKGSLETSRSGWPPFSFSRRAHASTFAR